MSRQWSYRPERAPECMNGRYECTTYECTKLLKNPGMCMACRRKNRNTTTPKETA
jgi:hypothetical protein